MHPKKICSDVESLGAKLTIDGDELYIENHMNINSELEQFVKSYKSRIIKYLKGEYADGEHAIKQTIDKIIIFYEEGCRVDSTINKWLQNDEKSLSLVMKLVVEFSYNGWSLWDPVCNYESEKTDKISKDIFDRAMSYFKGV
jgi:hypothetical protein